MILIGIGHQIGSSPCFEPVKLLWFSKEVSGVDQARPLPTTDSTYEDAALGISFRGRYGVITLDETGAANPTFHARQPSTLLLPSGRLINSPPSP